jgi:hypothetical protein
LAGYCRCTAQRQESSRWLENSQHSRRRSGTRSLPGDLNSRPRQAAARNPSRSGLSAKASSGSCEAAPDGKTCRRGFRPPGPAGGAFGTGQPKAYGSRCGAWSWPNWTPQATSTGLNPWPTAVLPRRNRGGLRREAHTGHGYAVEGGGRRPRCSFGNPRGFGGSGGSAPVGPDPGDDGRPLQRPRSAAQDA